LPTAYGKIVALDDATGGIRLFGGELAFNVVFEWVEWTEREEEELDLLAIFGG